VRQEIEVRVYQVSALNAEGALVNFATTDVAVLAIARLQEARARHLRAWVTDETGNDVRVPDLIARADAERADWERHD
jgi:PAB1-binding protein PBP1